MTNFQARPTIYNGIQMRSRLEAGFAMWLDKRGMAWAYEPHALAHPELGQYLPDFLLREIHCTWLGEPVDLYIDVKHRSFFGDDDDDDEDRDATDEEMRPYQEVERMARIVEANGPHHKLAIAQPGTDPPGLSLIEWQGRPPTKLDFYWPEHAEWTVDNTGRLMLTRIMAMTHGPWHGEWWKGGASPT